MDKIIIKVPGAPVREIELAPGIHKIGRSSDADLQIDHPSVSSSHCEITVNGSTVTIKDLGSTNGTTLDGQPVRESQITPGQALRLGEVDVQYGEAAMAKPSLRLAVAPLAEAADASSVPVPPPPAPYQVRLAPARPKRVSKTFYQNIPGAFVYPFKRNGFLLLITGTVIFGFFDAVLNFRVGGFLIIGGAVGGLFGAGITGYLFLYMQTIINSSAMGDEEMPNWPDYDGWWDSAFLPYLTLMAIGAACIAPSFLCLLYAGPVGRYLFLPVLFLGFCYAPMALLAVAMDDSLLGLNPLLVVPAIVRVPLEYLVSCLLFGFLFLLLAGLSFLNGVFLPPFVSQIIGMFFTLYFCVVEMRLLGLLYYSKKDRFGWRA